MSDLQQEHHGSQESGRHSLRRTVVAVAIVFVVLIVVGWWMVLANREPEEKFCTADGLSGPNGEIYGRDPDQGCLFVDDQGNPLPGQEPPPTF